MLERADHWTPPDSLGYSSLRPVCLTGLGIALVIAAAATLIGAVVLGVILERTARHQNVEQSLLRAQGLATDAVITRVWHTNGGRKSGSSEARNHIAYSFEYGGRRYARSMQVPTKIWRELAEGAILPVRFVPSQPSINHPTAWSSKPLAQWAPYLVAGWLAPLAGVMLIPLRRQSRLLSEGRPAPGRVTAIKKADKVLVVKYEFRLLSGVVAKGKSNVSKAPAGDAVLCVLYDPENPRRNALYPLSLVRLENAPAPPRLSGKRT